MTATDTPRRISWLDRQRLEAADLNDRAGREAFTRRLHTSVVHDAWGVALGFGIQVGSDGGAPTVLPGLAYDRVGREIVSGRPVTMVPPVPPVDGFGHWVDLVMRWAGVDDLAAGRDPSGACVGGPGLLEERPLLRWVDAGQVLEDATGALLRPGGHGPGVELGRDVPLARLVVDPDGRLSNLDLSSRRTAHGLARPHIAAGTVRQGVVDVDQGGDHRWWSMLVDTSDGGFTTSETTYLAVLGAHPWGETSGFNSGDVSNENELPRDLLQQQLPFAQGPFVELSGQDRTRFHLTVRHALPERLVRRGAITVPVNPVPVHWVGIEWVGGCEPPSGRMARLFLHTLPFIHWSTGTFTTGEPV